MDILSNQRALAGALDRSIVTALGLTGTVTLDCRLGNYASILAPTGNVTLALSNPPASGIGQTIMLIFQQHGTTARTLTFPASFKWPNGTAFVVSSTLGAVDLISFTTFDGGTTWLAAGAKAHA